MLQFQLQYFGIQSDIAIGGLDAIEMVRQRLDLIKNNNSSNAASISTYKLIFMDFSMPDLDGIQTSLNIYQIHRDHGMDPFDA